jgi:hypothetical protein
MAKKVYNSGEIFDINGYVINAVPLKIKNMRPFMDIFSKLSDAQDEDESLDYVISCAFIALEQYAPGKYPTKNDVESMFDLKTIYKILEYAAEIKAEKPEGTSKSQTEGDTWETLDLPALEAEAFLTGIWKNFEELESSLSMPELTLLLSTKRDLEYQQKKFDAAMQGVDLDEGNKSNAWEEMKARVFSGGKTDNGNDILALQGANAAKAGFGIGMGLDYEDLTKS